MAMLVEDIVSFEATERSMVYEIFAAAYLQLPTRESIKGFLDFVTEFSRLYPIIEFTDFVALVVKRNEMIAGNENDDVLDVLRQEYYDHLFVPSSGNYVPPFESVVKNNSLWGAETLHCAECYDSLGFDPCQLDMFPPLKEVKIPDHIGYQLAFMAFMARGESQAETEEQAERWRSLQYQFLWEHLVSWLPGYADAVSRIGSPYYAGLAALLAKYVGTDITVLAESQRMRGDLT